MKIRQHNRRLLTPFLAMLVLTTFALPCVRAAGQDRTLTHEQGGAKVPMRTALVIGNAKYRHASALLNPANDARDMAAALRSLGFDVLSGEDLTADQMKRLIQTFGEKLARGGTGLFYYAGHGAQVAGRNYLIPVDAENLREKTIEFEAVDVSRVLGEMDAAGNGLNIVILDACRNNPFAKSWRSASDGLAMINAPAGTLIAYATSPGAVASDNQDGRNGLYTQELLNLIKEPDVSVEELFKRVRARVKERSGGRQVPWESSSLVGSFSFKSAAGAGRTGAGQGASASNTELMFWDSIKGSTDPEDFGEYLKKYPAGQFEGLARRRLAALSSATKPGGEAADPNAAAGNNGTSDLTQQARDFLLHKRDYEAALQVTTTAILLNPQDAVAHRIRAGAFFRARNVEAGNSSAREALKLLTRPRTAAEFEARCYSRNVVHEYDLALSDCNEAIRLDPQFVMAHMSRANTLSGKRDYDQAITSYSEAIRLDPKYATAFYARGDVYRFKREYDRAESDYNTALSLDPKYTGAYIGRAMTYANRKEYDRAARDLDEAIRIDPKYAYAFYARGNMYADKRDYEQAIKDFTEAIKLDPKYAYAYQRRGLVYYQKKDRDSDRALKDFDESVRLEPKFAQAYFSRGNVYLDKEDYKQAIRDFSETVNLEPTFPVGYFSRGNAYHGKKEYDLAIKDYNEAIRLDPKLAVAYNNRGSAYAMKKNFEQALRDYNEAISLDPNKAYSYNGRAAVYEKLGEKERAKADREKAKALAAEQ